MVSFTFVVAVDQHLAAGRLRLRAAAAAAAAAADPERSKFTRGTRGVATSALEKAMT